MAASRCDAGRPSLCRARRRVRSSRGRFSLGGGVLEGVARNEDRQDPVGDGWGKPEERNPECRWQHTDTNQGAAPRPVPLSGDGSCDDQPSTYDRQRQESQPTVERPAVNFDQIPEPDEGLHRRHQRGDNEPPIPPECVHGCLRSRAACRPTTEEVSKRGDRALLDIGTRPRRRLEVRNKGQSFDGMSQRCRSAHARRCVTRSSVPEGRPRG